MKILCRTRDEVLKDKEAYQTQYNQQKAAHESEQRQYREAQFEVFDSVKAAIEQTLSRWVGPLNLDIRVDSNVWNNLQVRIQSNEFNVHDDAKALSWSYSAKLVDGQLEQESGSWSGLNAVTAEQLDSLQMSVDCLRAINAIDWMKLLSTKVPEYQDYVKTRDPGHDESRKFDDELLALDIEDMIGTNTWVKLRQGHDYRGDVYVRILKETPKQYTVTEMPARPVEQGDMRYKSDYSYNVRKDKFFEYLYNPLVTVEV